MNVDEEVPRPLQCLHCGKEGTLSVNSSTFTDDCYDVLSWRCRSCGAVMRRRGCKDGPHEWRVIDPVTIERRVRARAASRRGRFLSHG